MKLPNSLAAVSSRLLLMVLTARIISVAHPASATPVRRAARPAARKAAASPAIRTVVDTKGRLRLSPAQMRVLRPKVASNGLVCLEFPLSVLRKPLPQPKAAKPPGASRTPGEEGHNHSIPDFAPRVWITAAADGSLTLVNTRLIPGDERVPGAPGTVYLIRNQEGRLQVQKPGPKS